MKALILAGGFGTRMRPLTDHVPKSLLPICNRPFLEHQIRLLARHGVTDATLLTGYLPRDFPGFATKMLPYGVTVEISTEREPLGTAGAVRSKLQELDATTLVFNGDVLTDLDVSALLAFHREKNALITLALTAVDDARAYGLVPLDPDGRVQAFLEKPAEPIGGLINAGTYVLEPRALAEIPADAMWSFETQLFPSLLAAGEPFYGFASEAYWLDIGTPQRYLQAHFDVLEGRADAAADGEMMRESKTFDDGTAILAPSLISHAPVGRGARIGPLTTLGRGARIGAGAVVERSVIHGGAEIGEGAIVRDSIVGSGARVEAGSTLENAVVA